MVDTTIVNNWLIIVQLITRGASSCENPEFVGSQSGITFHHLIQWHRVIPQTLEAGDSICQLTSWGGHFATTVTSQGSIGDARLRNNVSQ